MSIYDGKTKAELLAAIEEQGLHDKIATYAKFPAKPTNDELIAVLESVNSESQEPVVVEKVIDESYKVTDKESLSQLETDLMIPVIVTDHDTSVTTEENIENKVFKGSIGNIYTGTVAFSVALHGKMQYLPKIVVDHLKEVTMASNYKNAAGVEVSDRSRKRFSVVEVQGWTDEELEAHRQEQISKKVNNK